MISHVKCIKRLIWNMLTLSLTLIILSSASISQASNYPKHLNGDPNWVLVNAHQGVAWYMDKSSVAVQKYAPPDYQIAVNVMRVSFTTNGFDLNLLNSPQIYETETHYYYYNWDSKRMYKLGSDNKWHYMTPVGDYASTSSVVEGELTFYTAYRMKFYGGRQYKYTSPLGDYSYSEAVPDEVYLLIDAY